MHRVWVGVLGCSAAQSDAGPTSKNIRAMFKCNMAKRKHAMSLVHIIAVEEISIYHYRIYKFDDPSNASEFRTRLI